MAVGVEQYSTLENLFKQLHLVTVYQRKVVVVMKTAMIQRKFDELGRIFIPAEFRKELGIQNHLNVHVFVSEPDDDGIITMETDSQMQRFKIYSAI